MKQKSSRNDLTADQIVSYRKLETSFLDRCRQFGYKEIRTSTIEPLYIFTALGALSEQELRRMYSFIDWDGWSGERVALKPDSTTCVARYYGDHLRSVNPRQKLCYVENHFKLADTLDKFSERWQFGIENIGSARPEADIETIYMARDILSDVGAKPVYLHLSHPSIIKEMINGLHLPADAEKDLLDAIRNESGEEIKKILGSASDKKAERDELAWLLSPPVETNSYTAAYLKNLKHNLHTGVAERVGPALANFESICERLDSLECEYKIDFSLLGNLEYYSGVNYQFLSTPARKSNRDVLCSGGRYDNFIGRMWNLEERTPAVGFALFIRNILKFIPSSRDALQNICIFIEDITRGNVKTGQILCDKLRKLGFEARISFSLPAREEFKRFGLVIKVDDKIDDGYKILDSQKIGKPLLMNLFGEFND
ncbi:MAG: hypothetical protein GY859_07430, partial [Desulfobacterales bacterium]|nr:hypothetical protein [Desulfobacterales bacterium]